MIDAYHRPEAAADGLAHMASAPLPASTRAGRGTGAAQAEQGRGKERCSFTITSRLLATEGETGPGG
ncbi:hypothetical protein [Streptomyces sp. H39-S7]|uniref:hypothetical protein n=1 Tax=Streptomyces sp. H39-S7 TaxID=3004357 RepID=UPI0022AE6636|nr:hypothetical protein [Streptomyces sp. H39-S7]MCZ4120271.1 hypothetical protein [Streptomyces sp. H39-S7]